jgi:hypothetical protein
MTQRNLDPPVKKVVKFSSTREVRLFSEETPSNNLSEIIPQVCSKVESSLKQLKPKLYILPTVCGLDHSLREVFYKAYFTFPTANTLAIEEEEDDFYYT